MTDAAAMLTSMGAGVVRVLHRGAPVEVSVVHILGESPTIPAGALVLDLRGSADHLASTIESLSEAGAAGLVVRSPFAGVANPALGRADLTVGELDVRMGTSHFVWLLHTVLNRSTTEFSDAATVQADLFAVADAIGSMLSTSVTIEDAQSRVVAYSSTHGVTDEARTSTIMGRAVPAHVVRRLRGTGAFRRLVAGQDPFVVPATENFRRRVVVPVKVGSELIGSIWIIYEGELTTELASALARSAAAVALNLVRLRTHEADEGRYSIERVRQALRGGDSGDASSLVLPWPAFRTVALARLGSASAFDDLTLWRQFFQRSGWSDPILADVDGSAFAVMGGAGGPGGWQWLCDLTSDLPGRAAASRPITDVNALAGGRAEATHVLRLETTNCHTAVAYEEVWAAVVLDNAQAALGIADNYTIQAFVKTDVGQQTALALTTLFWLECQGDVASTAQRLHIHPNTVRYRLKRARAALACIDFTRADHRLATLLLLRLSLSDPTE